MRVDRENAAALAAFAFAVFISALLFGDAGQVVWRLAAAAAASGLALGAFRLKAWRRLTLVMAWPVFIVFACLAFVAREMADHDYGPMMGVDITWLPITSIVYGLPAFLIFLATDAIALAIVRKT